MRALEVLSAWPVAAAAGVLAGDGPAVRIAGDGPAVRIAGTAGPVDRPFPWASVTKLCTTLAVLVAVEDGTIGLDDPAGPAGATVAHLLAHASGLGPSGDAVLAPPGRRRIYSNAGFELLGALLADRSAIPFPTYLAEAVLGPLGMTGTHLGPTGSPASGLSGTLADLLALGTELLAPSLVDPTTLATATSVAFPGLAGVLPGFGRQDPCDWGLGFELRDGKRPHWTGDRNSPQTFGHFGQSGSFLWVDPVARVACAGLADRDFGPWAAEVWPELADRVLAELG
ncbi:MAG TPA: serine hydrolase domain-containing protein [Acidimicrobiales bacterium]|nr:serine hydrolase domain-containing protein [Acidimicrobiales bacterium]